MMPGEPVAVCSREEMSGRLKPMKSDGSGATFAHRLEGGCYSGNTHGNGPSPSLTKAPQGSDLPTVEKPWDLDACHIEMVHPYRAKGRTIFEVARLWKHSRPHFGGATSFPRHRGPDGLLYWGIGEKWRGNPRRPLYRQGEALEALKHGRCVYLVEGERDVDAMVAAGYDAACCPFGAGKFTKPQAARIRKAMRANPEASVQIIADDDEPGIAHAMAVYRLLTPTADLRRRVTATRPPNGFHDMADALSAGLGVGDD